MSAPCKLVGRQFGRLTVISYFGSDDGRIWNYMCSCGTAHRAKTGHLNAGAVTSCGCAQLESAAETGRLYGHLHATHGMRHHRLYNTYRNMVARCYKPQNKRYSDYGGRGITVCADWLNSREVFFVWALENGYSDDLQIDRIDNDAGYSPKNCQWVTLQENVSNTRKNRLLTWGGKTMTVTSWAREIGVKQQTLDHRVQRGWDVERIFTQPFRGVA